MFILYGVPSGRSWRPFCGRHALPSDLLQHLRDGLTIRIQKQHYLGGKSCHIPFHVPRQSRSPEQIANGAQEPLVLDSRLLSARPPVQNLAYHGTTSFLSLPSFFNNDDGDDDDKCASASLPCADSASNTTQLAPGH